MTSSRTTSVSVRMPNELREWVIAQIGKGSWRSMSDVINDLVREAKGHDNNHPRGK
jgi:Arc/MetJ-type ribon-helix-helix transcriptional regulator